MVDGLDDNWSSVVVIGGTGLSVIDEVDESKESIKMNSDESFEDVNEGIIIDELVVEDFNEAIIGSVGVEFEGGTSFL